MIDEKKLIEKIEKMVIPLSTPDGSESIDIGINGYNECLVDVLGTIKEQPKVGEWIPVEERLPEKETYVLCYIPKVDGNVQYGIYVGRRLKIKANDGSGNFWGIPTKECDWSLKGWSYIDHPTIVAWQPLPEPFKGETE